MNQVLLLNSSYEPLNICSWKRAIILLLKGKAVTVERNGKQIKTGSPRQLAEALASGGHTISHEASPTVDKDGVPLPTVIRLLYYVKIPHKDIPLTRRNLMHRDNYTCQYCGKKNDLTIDHVIPRSRGGQDRWDNVVAACLRCNVGKGSKTPKEAGLKLAKRPCRPVNFIHFEVSKQGHVDKSNYSLWQKYMYE